MPGPIHPRLLRRAQATRRFMLALVAAGIASSGLLIAQAWLLADWISRGFAGRALPDGWQLAAIAILAVFAGRGLLAWLSTTLAHYSAAAVKSELRRDTLAARLATPVGGASSASVTRILTQGLDALDGYFSKYLPQLGLAMTVPFIVGAAILIADWPSAIIVAVTLPLIPIFMALIGWTTQKATTRSFAVADRLANHFADLIAGLPTLQAFARARAQRRGVELNEDAYRGATMKTLYVSFLSSFALELLASLSVAVVAVTVGFRLVYGEIGFGTALFVLILAPEAFQPVRQVGVHFHDSADGVAAADAAFAIVDAAPTTGRVASRGTNDATRRSRLSRKQEASSNSSGPGGGTPCGVSRPRPYHSPDGLDTFGMPNYSTGASKKNAHEGPGPRSAVSSGSAVPSPMLSLDAVSYTYPGADTTTLDGFSLSVAAGEVVALSGSSGGGKSTALALAMGFLSPTAGTVLAGGRDLAGVDLASWRSQVAWVAQTPGLVRGTAGDNVALGHPTASPEDIAAALADAGAGFSPDKPIGDDGEGLSAGERRRVALARALVRIRLGGARLLILDEPTAGLDAGTEARVIAAVRSTGAGALVVSHRPAVLAAADRVVTLTRQGASA